MNKPSGKTRATMSFVDKQATPAAGASLTGHLVASRYQVGEVLGRGGIGAVYRARHVVSGQDLALKTLLPEISHDPVVVERFRREAQAGSLLDHPHLVDALDSGVLADGTLYLVMELVEGASLAKLIDHEVVRPRRALVLMRQLLEALVYTHGRGIIHRDLKPENVMVTTVEGQGGSYERIRVLDFGLVKLFGEAATEVVASDLTSTGTTFGTPGYMAPEQALGRPLDPRVDLYAVGVMLFELLTQVSPFYNTDIMALLRMHVLDPRPTLQSVVGPKPWVTPAMEYLVARALERQREQRFASADEMMSALDAAFLSLDELPADGH